MKLFTMAADEPTVLAHREICGRQELRSLHSEPLTHQLVGIGDRLHAHHFIGSLVRRMLGSASVKLSSRMPSLVRDKCSARSHDGSDLRRAAPADRMSYAGIREVRKKR